MPLKLIAIDGRPNLAALPVLLLWLYPEKLPIAYSVHVTQRPELAVWKGDQVSATIAAASVLAKCERDRQMDLLHQQYPQFGFDGHKGYTTGAHREALHKYGPSPVHRHRFITVRRAIREGAA